MNPYFVFELIAYINNNDNIGLLLLCYEPAFLCKLCTTVYNVKIKKSLSKTEQFKTKGLSPYCRQLTF